MLNTMKISLPADLEARLREVSSEWNGDGRITRIWQKDASVWTGEDEAKWLGWLEIVGEEMANVSTYVALQEDIAQAGFTDVLLMGMGGSSLGPEVLAKTFGKEHFHILDSTVPAQVKTVEGKISIDKTLFIVASKSGSTLEPNCFFQYFFDLVSKRNENPGEQFVAITDPGSKMEQIARDNKFRHIFHGKPEIGGRFSALSAFGLTAAASMGLDVELLLKSAGEMVEACRPERFVDNPSARLGAMLGVCHAAGRDKLTIITSPEFAGVGAWLEQLIAESTGKNGVAIIPVDGEPVRSSSFSSSDRDKSAKAGTPNSSDRVYAFLGIDGDAEQAKNFSDMVDAGHPAIRIQLESTPDLAQEFFRWEFATAVAGSVMKINPFNQPDVEAAKIESRKLTDEYERIGSLPDEQPFVSDEGMSLFAGEEYAKSLTANGGDVEKGFKTHLDQIVSGDYFALLAYVEMNKENERLLQQIRVAVLEKYNVATCLGFGPRFLHSTGQAYKGGPNTGVFLQITSDDAFDVPVPAQKYSFGVVKAAQARGDFQVLVDRRRRALRVHLGADVVVGLERLAAMI